MVSFKRLVQGVTPQRAANSAFSHTLSKHIPFLFSYYCPLAEQEKHQHFLLHIAENGIGCAFKSTGAAIKGTGRA